VDANLLFNSNLSIALFVKESTSLLLLSSLWFCGHLTGCYVCTCTSPQYLYVEIFNLKVILLKGGDLRTWLDHWGRTLMNGTSALIKEVSEQSITYSSTCILSWEGFYLWIRKQDFTKLWIHWGLRLGLHNFQNYEK
jgi:hypothetical protein